MLESFVTWLTPKIEKLQTNKYSICETRCFVGEVSDQRWGNFNGCNVHYCRPKMAGVRKQTIRGEVKKVVQFDVSS